MRKITIMADSYQDLKSVEPTIVQAKQCRLLGAPAAVPATAAGDPVAELSILMQVCNFNTAYLALLEIRSLELGKIVK